MVYGIDVFRSGEIFTFIDIGAYPGDICIEGMRLLSPNRILAFEPCKENFDILLDSLKDTEGNIECYNTAYGDGRELYYLYKRARGMRRFLLYEEMDWNKAKRHLIAHRSTYTIQSKTFHSIFNDYSVDVNKPYIIKMDCEGCERFLLENNEDLYYVKNSALFTAEFHFFNYGFNGICREESNICKKYANWIFDNFSDSHHIAIGKAGIVITNFNELVNYFSRRKFCYIRLCRKDLAEERDYRIWRA